MTIQDLRNRNLILFECISGSRAYGTDVPTSDTDLRGVFILPQADLYGLNDVEQVNDDKNDVIFYELRRFIELLAKNNGSGRPSQHSGITLCAGGLYSAKTSVVRPTPARRLLV